MSNYIYPDTPKLMAEQRHAEMLQASENARLLNGISPKSRTDHRPRRSGRSFARKLAFALLVAFTAVLIAATIALAASGGGGVGAGSFSFM